MNVVSLCHFTWYVYIFLTLNMFFYKVAHNLSRKVLWVYFMSSLSSLCVMMKWLIMSSGSLCWHSLLKLNFVWLIFECLIIRFTHPHNELALPLSWQQLTPAKDKTKQQKNKQRKTIKTDPFSVSSHWMVWNTQQHSAHVPVSNFIHSGLII